jgi:hypothetical protein
MALTVSNRCVEDAQAEILGRVCRHNEPSNEGYSLVTSNYFQLVQTQTRQLIVEEYYTLDLVWDMQILSVQISVRY